MTIATVGPLVAPHAKRAPTTQTTSARTAMTPALGSMGGIPKRICATARLRAVARATGVSTDGKTPASREMGTLILKNRIALPNPKRVRATQRVMTVCLISHQTTPPKNAAATRIKCHRGMVGPV